MLSPALGRPKDLKKREAILASATQLFLELGYEGSSMDKIAKLAGVSKLTVYNHFQDKEHLFGAAISLACDTRIPKYLFEIDQHADVKEALLNVGCHFLSALYSPEAIKLTLLMSSLVQTNPEIVHLFYEAGPRKTHQNIEQLFTKIAQLRKMHIDNVTVAYQLFISLLTDINYNHVLWNIKPVPTEHEIQKHVLQQLDILFKVYPNQST